MIELVKTGGMYSDATCSYDGIIHKTVAQAIQDYAAKCISDSPTIDPETMPIVQELRAELERVKAERDAAIKELDEVSSAVDNLSDFIDEQIHPIVSYDIYTTLRDSADSIAIWQYKSEWCKQKKDK